MFTCMIGRIQKDITQPLIFQVNDEGDEFTIRCDPGVSCLNSCEWQLPNGRTCRIDAKTSPNDMVCNDVRFVGQKVSNCDEGNCIVTCDIRIVDADIGNHLGMWKCTSRVKINPGTYMDNVNVTTIVSTVQLQRRM